MSAASNRIEELISADKALSEDELDGMLNDIVEMPYSEINLAINFKRHFAQMWKDGLLPYEP